MGITVTDVTGAGVGGNPVPLAVGTSYRFSANPTNVYTGDIGGTPNTTTFSWDFNGDATEDGTGASPVYAFGTAGAYTLDADGDGSRAPQIRCGRWTCR